VAPQAPKREEIKADIGVDGKPDWTRYNATVVGAVYVPGWTVHKDSCLPGIPVSTQPYKMVSFAATREYGPDEGWIRIPTRKEKLLAAKRRQARRRAAAVEAGVYGEVTAVQEE
jgi:hypothetical protein